MRRSVVKFWHRFYDPETGRYISADPIGLRGGINLYRYANANPINWIDPDGLQSSAGSITAGPLPSPALHPVFQPGSAANDAFTSGTLSIMHDLWDKIDPDSIPDIKPPIDPDEYKEGEEEPWKPKIPSEEPPQFDLQKCFDTCEELFPCNPVKKKLCDTKCIVTAATLAITEL